MEKFKFFRLNLEKLPNYVRYFGSNNVEGVAEDWVEVQISWLEKGGGWNEPGGVAWKWVEVGGDGWSWVEVGARFSNTQK